VDDARRFAEHLVGVCTPECREAVTLAVCELGENLVKYSARDAPHAGTIGVSIDGARVRVRAKNRVCSPEDAAAVAAIVTRISHSDIQELYRASSPHEAGQIGALLDLYFALTSEAGTWSFEEMAGWQREAGLKPRKPIKFMTAPGNGQQSAVKAG
jgi:hypothetical protein